MMTKSNLNGIVTSSKEKNCLSEHLDTYHERNNLSELFCNRSWDGISCWPVTESMSTARVPCFTELNGVKYDTNDNATRECLEDGIWSNWSNYRSCKPLKLPDHEYIQVLWDMKDAATVYYIGYGISLVALVLALFVFLHFKDLRCLRNDIHTNLMVTYLLIDITWISTAILQSSNNTVANKVACFLVILLTYLMGTNFFWMFVEGLYLFFLVVKTFYVDSIRFQTYSFIGWGVPAIVVIIWASVKYHLSHTVDPLERQGCAWQNRDNFDFIFICPVISVLLINIVFLATIMWVLITKLRASNTMESEQYRKAAKALLVLIPLLGVTYILVIATPTDHTAEVIFTYIQTALLSIQGLIVTILYCFLNGEVRNTLRHHIERWKMQRHLNERRHRPLECPSPTPTPSNHNLALYTATTGRDMRGSCTSFSTSTSFVNFSTAAAATRPSLVPDPVPDPVPDIHIVEAS